MLLFIDESGTDHKQSPYEVLAGVGIQERDLWNFIQSIRTAEREKFGMELAATRLEIKGNKLLKSKVFRLAAQAPALPPDQRRQLAGSFLKRSQDDEQGPSAPQAELTAYGQACLAFCDDIFQLCARFNVRVFGALVRPDAPLPAGSLLRKDYSYLFERFFYYLEDHSPAEMGLVVFDERERSLCARLQGQMAEYFSNTNGGRVRSARVVPEPFFVHSDLTTAVQVADVVAYSMNWGLRLKRMTAETRPEMEHFGRLSFELGYVGQRPTERGDQLRPMYGIFYLDDLRPMAERRQKEKAETGTLTSGHLSLQTR